MKILIIEDKDMQACLQRALKDKSEERDALGTLEHQVQMIEPDVILMDKSFTVGSFTFTPDNMTLEYKGKVTHLTIYQTKVLYLLYVCMNMTVTREEIYRMIWNEEVVTEQSLNNIISQLRKTLRPDGHISIENIRGVGYRLKNNS
jgi:DNA-binding winged helix-turn-helix (wHTH) protein